VGKTAASSVDDLAGCRSPVWLGVVAAWSGAALRSGMGSLTNPISGRESKVLLRERSAPLQA
jgi:hypothetical protein